MKEAKDKLQRTKSNSQNKKTPRVAIVHGWLWKMRGAERCLEVLCEMFPQADIYMLFGNTDVASKKIKSHTIFYSGLNKLPLISKLYKWTLPLWPVFTEKWNFNQYDLVISSSAAVAKGVITSPETLHICYMYTPFRYLWDQRHLYFSNNYSKVVRIFISPWLHLLRIWDSFSTERVDLLISISEFVSERIKKYYGREPDTLIYPPVDTSKTVSANNRDKFYTAISPFEENKGLEVLLRAAVELKFQLKIIGTADNLKKLQKKYGDYDNIQFMGWVTELEKLNLLSRSMGTLFLGKEEFGIAAVEAIASGSPVIVMKESGTAEFVKNGVNGVILENNNLESIKKAMIQIEKGSWNREKMLKSVGQFSVENFKTDFRKIMDSLMLEGGR